MSVQTGAAAISPVVVAVDVGKRMVALSVSDADSPREPLDVPRKE